MKNYRPKISTTLFQLLFFFSVLTNLTATTQTIKIQGSTTVNPIISDIAEIFREEKKYLIHIDTHGGSSSGISSVAEGLADIGMISKDLSEKDKKKYPGVNLLTFPIGIDAVALTVSLPVFKSGIRSLTKQQVCDIYEKKIKRWSEIGSYNRRIVFFDKEPGRGTWEVFAKWAYGSHSNTPSINHSEVGSNEEASTKTSFNKGAITQLSFAWAQKSNKLKALGIQLEDGSIIEPTRPNIKNGQYPITRTLYLLTAKEPEGKIKEIIDFARGTQGQSFVVKHGYLTFNE